MFMETRNAAELVPDMLTGLGFSVTGVIKKNPV